MVTVKVGGRLALLAAGGVVAGGVLTSCTPADGTPFVLGSVISYAHQPGSPAHSTFDLAYTCSPGVPVTFAVNLVGSLPAGKVTALEGTQAPVKASCTGAEETVTVTTVDKKGAGGVASGGAGVIQGIATITEFDNGVPHYFVQQVDIQVTPSPA